MADKDVSKIKTTVVNYDEFSEYEFIPPANFYIMDSMQNYFFIHTSKREDAQAVVNEVYGKGRYTVVASKQMKTKSRQEDGGYSAVGVGTRKGQKKY